ncbi:MAG: DUF4390 domain-containing protein [Acidobacteriota bacterium]
MPATATFGAEISKPVVTVEENRALIDFELSEAFDERFLDRIQSGLPTGFVYRLELRKDRKRWYDRPMRETTLQVVAMYDAVAREYLVNTKLGGKLVESRGVTDLADLEREMTRVIRLPAFELDEFPSSWRLIVRVRAEMGSKTLLSFIPVTIKTDWGESKKFRTKNALPDGA